MTLRAGASEGEAIAAPIIVAAVFGGEDQARFDRLRERWFPPARNQLAAHLTLFHHLPPSALAELKHRLSQETRGVPAPRATAAGLMSLGGGVAIRIEAPDLLAVRASIADAFRGMLTPQDAAGWRPHVTVQNKVSAAEAKAALAEIERDFRPTPVVIAGLAAYYYRGGPWERISRFMFA